MRLIGQPALDLKANTLYKLRISVFYLKGYPFQIQKKYIISSNVKQKCISHMCIENTLCFYLNPIHNSTSHLKFLQMLLRMLSHFPDINYVRDSPAVSLFNSTGFGIKLITFHFIVLL